MVGALCEVPANLADLFVVNLDLAVKSVTLSQQL